MTNPANAVEQVGTALALSVRTASIFDDRKH
jgi:hypothetical protein